MGNFIEWNIPVSWEWTTLSSLGETVSGGTPSTKVPEYWGDEINWISPSDLSGYKEKYIRSGAKSLTQIGLDNSSAKVMPVGSIHFSSRAPIGYVVISSEVMSTNQGFKSLVPANGVFNEYVYYYLKSAKKAAEDMASGTTFKEISGAAFVKLPIPLPPLPEQKRIVAKIEELFSELDKGIESFKTAREQLKVYRQALLKHAFEGELTAAWREANVGATGRSPNGASSVIANKPNQGDQKMGDQKAGDQPVAPTKHRKPLSPLTVEELAELPELPDGWGWVKLGNCDAEIFDGPFGSNLKSDDYVADGVRVIRLENIGNLKFIEGKESYVSTAKYDSLKGHTVSAGDIIFASFITEDVRVVLLPENVTKAINKADCFCVRLFGESANKKYVEKFLSTRQVYKRLESLIHGVGRPRINTTQLKTVAIPLCSANEQSEIVNLLEDRLSALDNLDQTITTALHQSEGLRQSILKKAFSGQLVPQDPNDEPAAELLARIKAERETAGATGRSPLHQQTKTLRKPRTKATP